MRLLTATVSVVVVLGALAGCSSKPEPAAAPSSTPSAGSSGDAVEPSSPAVLEGPVSSGARWPDGLSARLTAVERVPSSWASDVPRSLVIVRLTLEVSNGTGAVLPVEPMTREMDLLYGPNREEADPVAGFSYPDPAEGRRKGLQRDGGTRIPVGGRATFVESGLVPAGAVQDLTVQVKLPSADGIRDPFTLTGVGSVVKTVR
ncbi:hypothetical protein AB0B63_06850 [Micromonospora sp. NPDC049081]|uniref:hypothetical protein n=1 Tax=Micromonospora sp. NPDC049081 TaxID=3155150 RepID=UPI0033F92843